MHVDPYIVMGSAAVGFLVGLTGAGGGALMTPMLILAFGIRPSHPRTAGGAVSASARPPGRW